MAFTSISFLLFLTIVVTINYLIPTKKRWILLLVASYYFYINWQPLYSLLLLSNTVVSYFAAIQLARTDLKPKIRSLICAVAIIFPLISLGLFKYYTFVTDSINSILTLLHLKIYFPQLDLLVPIGISFYSFTTIGYIIDVYKRKYTPERNFGIYALFISFFAQIASGPIPRGNLLIPQLKNPENLSYSNVMSGLRTMLWGFFMKLCVADRLSVYVDTIYGNLASHNGGSVLLASLLYTVQIYCDFAGYSFIAIGAARMLGIRLMDNFRRPYFATGVKDFWSRWHISLSTWFRDYVYIPLGGNRVSKTRHRINLMVTFLVSGLWHGASWNFIAWGGLHGAGQISEKRSNDGFRINGAVKMFLTFAFVSFCWMFFRLISISDAFHGISKIFVDFGIPFINSVLFYGLITLVVVVIKDFVDEFHPHIKFLNSDNFWISNIATGILAATILLFGAFGAGSFIYFQF